MGNMTRLPEFLALLMHFVLLADALDAVKSSQPVTISAIANITAIAIAI